MPVFRFASYEGRQCCLPDSYRPSCTPRSELPLDASSSDSYMPLGKDRFISAAEGHRPRKLSEASCSAATCSNKCYFTREKIHYADTTKLAHDLLQSYSCANFDQTKNFPEIESVGGVNKAALMKLQTLCFRISSPLAMLEVDFVSRLFGIICFNVLASIFFRERFIMKISARLTLIVGVIFLNACATNPQKAVGLSPNTFSSKGERVGVAMTKLPKVDTYLPGAGCLLCVAAAAIANSSLTAHTQTLPYEDLPVLKNQMAELLRRKGMQAKIITEDIDIDALPDYKQSNENIAKKDFGPLQKKYDIEKILVISISNLGMERPYSAYIPAGDPKAVLRGTGYIVNIKNNTYEWYLPVNVLKSSDGKWDEPPKFPGLTNAYFQTLEIAKNSFLKPFKE